MNYHTLIFSRRAYKPLVVRTESLRGRVAIIRLDDFENKSQLYIVGVYGVSFNEKNKIAHRQFFDDLLAKVLSRLASPIAKIILVGDLNVVEHLFHSHVPEFVASSEFFFTGLEELGFFDSVRAVYPTEATYTWYSQKTGEGQRLDHIFTLGGGRISFRIWLLTTNSESRSLVITRRYNSRFRFYKMKFPATRDPN